MSKKVSSAAASPKTVTADKINKVGKTASTSETGTDKPPRGKSRPSVSLPEPVEAETESKRSSSRSRKTVSIAANVPDENTNSVVASPEKPARKTGRKAKSDSLENDSVQANPAAEEAVSATVKKSSGRKSKEPAPELSAPAADSEKPAGTEKKAKPGRPSKKAEPATAEEPASPDVQAAGVPEPEMKPEPEPQTSKGKNKKSTTKRSKTDSGSKVDASGQKPENISLKEIMDETGVNSDDETGSEGADLNDFGESKPQKRPSKSRKNRDVDPEERQDVFDMQDDDRISEEEDDVLDDEEMDDEELEDENDDFDSSYDDDSGDGNDDSDDLDDSDDISYDDDDEPVRKRKVRRKKSKKVVSSDKKSRLLKKKLDALNEGPCKICWGLFSPEMKKIQEFDFCDEAKARAKAAELTQSKGMRYFVQRLKVPIKPVK